MTNVLPAVSRKQGCAAPTDTDLEAPIVFRDLVRKVDLLPLAQELSQLRPVVHAQVVAHKVPVEAVPPPLLPVQQQVGGWIKPGDGEREGTRQRTDGRDGGQDAAAASLTFFPHLDVLLAGHVLPPGLLDGPGVAVELALPGLLQQKELQGGTDGEGGWRDTR